MRVALFIQVLQKKVQKSKSMDTLPPIIMVTELEKLNFKNILSCLAAKTTNFVQPFFGGKLELHLQNFQAFLVTKGRMC